MRSLKDKFGEVVRYDMGKGRISVEGFLARGLLVAAVGGALVACSRGNSVEPTITPIPTTAPLPTPGPVPVDCKGGTIYPENKHIRLRGEYLLKPVTTENDECFFVLANHPRLKAQLQVYKEAIILMVLIPEFPDDPMSAMGSVPPRSDYTIEYEFRGLNLKISLTKDGEYLIEYSFDESKVPPMPTPVPTPRPDFHKPYEGANSW